jgi:predicted signal transduction protein with EAL and GGDEF domain
MGGSSANSHEVELALAISIGRQARRGRILSAAAIPAVAALMYGRFENAALLGWLVTMIMEALLDLFIAKPRTKRIEDGDLDNWKAAVGPHYAAFGLAWGSLALFALPGGRPEALWLSTIVVLALITVYIATTAASRLLFGAGMVGSAVPLATALAVSGTAPMRLAVLAVVYCGIAIVVHDAMHRLLINSVRSQHEAELISAQLNAFVTERDPATQLLNRRSFIAALDRLLAGHPDDATVEVANLRRLTAINELYGQQFGDALIGHVGSSLRAVASDTTIVARLGGDEFAIAWVGDTPANPSIRDLAGGPFSSSGITTSADFACATASSQLLGGTAEELVTEAMYSLRAARAGRPVRREQRSGHSAHDRRELVDELRAGLCEAGVRPWFQPLVDATTRDVVGWEALVRWHHPVLGVVSPDRLLPLIEMSGMSAQLFELMVGESLEFLTMVDGRAANNHVVNVNINATDLRNGSMPDTVLAALYDSQVAAGRLVLELTEREILHADHTVRTALSRLDSAGVHLAVDDFGTGYSSLSHLLDFPADHLKIDRRFIGGLPGDTDALALVKGIVSMAHGLGLTTVAEGVETEEAAAVVHAVGCDQLQGYLMSPAMRAADALDWWRPRAQAEAPALAPAH